MKVYVRRGFTVLEAHDADTDDEARQILADIDRRYIGRRHDDITVGIVGVWE